MEQGDTGEYTTRGPLGALIAQVPSVQVFKCAHTRHTVSPSAPAQICPAPDRQGRYQCRPTRAQ
jgi:hypothetical protein